MNNNKREYGFYWVRLRDVWLVAEWLYDNYRKRDSFLLTGDSNLWFDADFDKIKEKRIINEQ